MRMKALNFDEAKIILKQELGDLYNGEQMPKYLHDKEFINYYGGFYIDQAHQNGIKPKPEAYIALTHMDVTHKLGVPRGTVPHTYADLGDNLNAREDDHYQVLRKGYFISK